MIRLKALERDGALGFPVIAVNDAQTKHLFDNRYGTGQSTIDGIIRATNVLLAGKRFVVAGYGWVGRGVASRARGMGSHVIITEVDPMRALEASMDGYEVLTMEKAASIGDIFCTATGDKSVIRKEHIQKMKDGAILANTGHFNVEIDIPGLRSLASDTREARAFVEEFTMAGGQRIYLIADGRLVNLSAAEGHPALVMDMSFANQALSAEYAIQNAAELERKVYPVPVEIDKEIARLKLDDDGRRHRQAHGGAGEVPGLVGRRNLEARDIVRYEEDGPKVVLLDQRRLPDEEVELECRSVAEVVAAIRELAIRGAPAIGDRGCLRARACGRAWGGPRRSRGSPRRRAPDRGQSRLGARADARRSDPRARPRAARGRGRTLSRHGRARGGALRRRHACADALQRGRARDGRLRQRRRRAAHRVGARACSSASGSTRRGRCCRARA